MKKIRDDTESQILINEVLFSSRVSRPNQLMTTDDTVWSAKKAHNRLSLNFQKLSLSINNER